MKRPGFLEGVVVALVASLVAGSLFVAATWLFPAGLVLRGLVAGLGLAYVLYLLARSHERVGRITSFALWSVVTAAVMVEDPPVVVHVVAQLGLVWLLRSLYFHSSALASMGDFALGTLSLAAATWAASASGSVFLSVWALFLVQALFVAIPANFPRRVTGSRMERDDDDRFQRAHRAAETAVRRLSTVR